MRSRLLNLLASRGAGLRRRGEDLPRAVDLGFYRHIIIQQNPCILAQCSAPVQVCLCSKFMGEALHACASCERVNIVARTAAVFHQLLAFAPQDDEAHFGLGLLAVRGGQMPEAATHFRASLAANPLYDEAHYQVGLILVAQNHKQEAVREFNAALDISPQYNDAHRELAKLTSPGR